MFLVVVHILSGVPLRVGPILCDHFLDGLQLWHSLGVLKCERKCAWQILSSFMATVGSVSCALVSTIRASAVVECCKHKLPQVCLILVWWDCDQS